MEDGSGKPYVRVSPRIDQHKTKRVGNRYMVMYFEKRIEELKGLSVLAENNYALKQLSSRIAQGFYTDDEYPNDVSHDYYHTSVCLGLYNNVGSKVSLVKVFLN